MENNESMQNNIDNSADKLSSLTDQKSQPEVSATVNTSVEAIASIDEDEHTEETEDIIEDYSVFSKAQLIEALKTLLNTNDYLIIKNKIIAIRTQFWTINQLEKEERLRLLSEENTPKEEQDIQDPSIEQFNNLYSQYRHMRANYLQQQEKEKDKNLATKLDILEQIKVLIDSEDSLKKTYDDLKELQNRWKEVGLVAKTENDNLWKSYHFLIERFLDKVKINKELKDLDLKKNLETKLELCEKVELLLLESSIMKSFKELQRIHDQWKETGPAPSDKSNELWERFQSASEKIHERRREYYDKQKQERENNYISKVAICEKVEELNTKTFKTMRAWKDASEEILNLQNGWRTIGFAPEKLNDEVWQRFRTAINIFFDTKKEFFDKIQDEFTTNYNHKIELCVKAEAFKDSSDWNSTARELMFLQKKWKEIGPVSQKHSDAIWKRFRAACDHFFTRKDEYFKNIDSIEADNLKQKEELLNRILAFTPTDDNKQNIEQLKTFQREWMDSGHVPMSHKDRMYAAYKEAINNCYGKLNMSANEAGIVAFKSRIEPLFGSAEGERIIDKEVQNIRKLIQKITSDVTTWENNIGYFAKSKNADIVKQEFQKKIDHAKEDLKLQQDKLKFLTRRPNSNTK